MFRPSMDAKMRYQENIETSGDIDADAGGRGDRTQDRLETALKKLFGHICETLIEFQHKLQISGTIAITIDSESVMLLQFSELIINPNKSHHIITTTNSSNKLLTSLKKSDKNCKYLNNQVAENLHRNSSSSETIYTYSDNAAELNDGSNPQQNIHLNLMHQNNINRTTLLSPSSSVGTRNSQVSSTPPFNYVEAESDKPNQKVNSRCLSKLTQLLQTPVIAAGPEELNLSKQYLSPNLNNNINNKVWKPTSASEILKRMSTRVDHPVANPSNSSSSLNCLNERVSEEGVAHRDAPRSDQSFLQSILSGNMPSLSSISNMYNKKRKRQDHDNDSSSSKHRVLNSDSTEHTKTVSSSQSVSSSLLDDIPQRMKKESSPVACDPCDFSDYRYSMLLHKLVGVRQNQQHENTLLSSNNNNNISSNSSISNIANSNYFQCNKDEGTTNENYDDKNLSNQPFLLLSEIKKESMNDGDDDDDDDGGGDSNNNKHVRVMFVTGGDDENNTAADGDENDNTDDAS
ncbi:hypothetical protein HELRODRAFT_188064 [Helobdella robusta]|uniref:Uncharacterized protein n=1 Tax=Helobdella robusta TaxID=6412 RepID=T1FPL4_HELRO|nr:hypothetical protein HELRODRAFT_188064 [Helobdella robusta]ESO13001.1 hypothetical protein HELRODRAFT_188064 [Helobdella robusta]